MVSTAPPDGPTTRPFGLVPLSSVARLGLIGDVNGSTLYAIRAAKKLCQLGVRVIIQLGDLGLLNSRRDHPDLEWVNQELEAADQWLLFVDGNQDNFDELLSYALHPSGLRPITSRIFHLPRGYRTRLWDFRLAALGGASSADAWRGHWEQEAITSADLADLGSERAEIMIGHDAPLHVRPLEDFLASTAHRWPASGRVYARGGQETFHDGFLQVRPRVYVGSHYEHHVDTRVTYAVNGEAFETHVVLLDACGLPESKSMAILDSRTLEIRSFALIDSDQP